MPTTKEGSDMTTTTTTIDTVEEARCALEDAERHLAKLNHEIEVLKLEKAPNPSLIGGGQPNTSSPQAQARSEVKDRIHRRTRELYGYWEGKKAIAGELYVAEEAVASARRHLSDLLDPLLPLEVAQARLDQAMAEVDALAAEQDSITGAIRAAAVANDIEKQVALVRRNDDLPLLVRAARRKQLFAAVGVARAMVDRTKPAEGQPKSGQFWHWKNRETDLRRAVADAEREAVYSARGAATPVVRSRWQGTPRGTR